MEEKVASVFGTVIAYSVLLIGSYEIAAFAVERCFELVTTSHNTIFDRAINKIKNHGYTTVERKEEEA